MLLSLLSFYHVVHLLSPLFVSLLSTVSCNVSLFVQISSLCVHVVPRILFEHSRVPEPQDDATAM